MNLERNWLSIILYVLLFVNSSQLFLTAFQDLKIETLERKFDKTCERKVADGDSLHVHYTGKLADDGYVFESRDLENAANNLTPPNAVGNLCNSALLSLDPSQDRSAFYQQMIQSYKWTDKVREFAGHAAAILSQNSLKRSGAITKRVRKPPQNSHCIPTQMVDNAIQNFERHFPNMQIEVDRPFGTSTVLQITLAKTLKAIIIQRSLIIEWVVIKAYHEETQNEDGKVDIWSNSRYKVFQKVTDHANAAMLHYYAPSYPDVAVKSFMLWLYSYSTLFTDPCLRCGNYLHDCLPPTWRDFRTLAAYHEACH